MESVNKDLLLQRDGIEFWVRIGLFSNFIYACKTDYFNTANGMQALNY